MKCPACQGHNTKVVDSRPQKRRRRRECKDCGKRFSTVETLAGKDALVPEQLSLFPATAKVEKRGDRIEKLRALLDEAQDLLREEEK